MDGSQFDVWTRRHFGLAAASVAASVVGIGAFGNGRAKKKKRCKKLQHSCNQGSHRKCCGDLKCRVTSASAGNETFCCKTEGKPCTMPSDCCETLGCCGPVGAVVCSSVCISDRNLKANFGSVDPGDMLARVRDLPISTWNYTADDPSVRHIGPMAQDFAAAFGVGADDRHINPMDGQGVALAAIQGLMVQVEELRAENLRLAARFADLESEAAPQKHPDLATRS